MWLANVNLIKMLTLAVTYILYVQMYFILKDYQLFLIKNNIKYILYY